MLTTDAAILNAYKAPVRRIEAKAAFYNDAALLLSINNNTALKSITLERTGDTSRFYGYGISHKANIKVIDLDRSISIAAGNNVLLDIINSGNSMRIAPKMYITECHRDEITNEISITAYDRLYEAAAHTVSELEIETPATIADYATAAANLLGLGLFYYADNAAFAIEYENGANLDGAETIRELLDAIAEATQSVYYISRYNTLIFKSFDMSGAAAYTIDKEQYITLDSGANRRLAAICHTTELGDSVEAKLTVSGTTQYVRDNPFYELREDSGVMVENALSAIGGLTINQFDCEWRGNPAIEIADKIAIIRNDDEPAYTYLLNDTLEYDGALKQHTQWIYEDNGAETAGNPSNLGDALNRTFARVDKVNREIDIIAGETQANTSNLAAIQMNTESIAASVSRIEENTTASINGVNTELATLTNKVEASLTTDGVRLLIQEELANGVDKVYTSTGFAFDADGLRVSKTGSEMETLLDEDGLSVFRDNTEVLTADNTGVNGINMTVRQYLIVGGSRFEAYGAGRTGCFWLG